MVIKEINIVRTVIKKRREKGMTQEELAALFIISIDALMGIKESGIYSRRIVLWI